MCEQLAHFQIKNKFQSAGGANVEAKKEEAVVLKASSSPSPSPSPTPKAASPSPSPSPAKVLQKHTAVKKVDPVAVIKKPAVTAVVAKEAGEGLTALDAKYTPTK